MTFPQPFTIIDLTHCLDEKTVSWNGDCGFSGEIVCDYQDCNSKVQFRVQKIHCHAGG